MLGGSYHRIAWASVDIVVSHNYPCYDPRLMDTRLKEVRQTDLTEGRINQEFLDWLQTKGMSWLLILLVGVCIYLGFVRWKSHQSNTRAEAWKTLQESRLPSALEKA